MPGRAPVDAAGPVFLRLPLARPFQTQTDIGFSTEWDGRRRRRPGQRESGLVASVARDAVLAGDARSQGDFGLVSAFAIGAVSVVSPTRGNHSRNVRRTP